MPSLYLYLGSEGLTFLKSGLLPFLRPVELAQPFLAKHPAYQVVRQNKLSQKDYISHLKQQYARLPDHLRSMVSFEYFAEQSEKKRTQIEAGIQKSESNLISCPDLSGYRLLRLFSDPRLLTQWQGKLDNGLVLELDARSSGWQLEDYRGQPQMLAELRSVDNWLPDSHQDWLSQQPGSYSDSEGEWRLIRTLPSADKMIQVKGQERAMYRLPYKGLKRVIVGPGWLRQRRDSLQTYIKQDLNLRQAKLAQLQLDPATMELAVIDL